MARYLDSIDENEILELYSKFPRSDDPVKIFFFNIYSFFFFSFVNSKCFSFLKETLVKERESIIFRGYHILRKAIKLVSENFRKPLSDEVIDNRINEISQSLRLIYPYTFRLEIIENLFSFLFLIRDDFVDLEQSSTTFLISPEIFRKLLTVISESLVILSGVSFAKEVYYYSIQFNYSIDIFDNSII